MVASGRGDGVDAHLASARPSAVPAFRRREKRVALASVIVLDPDVLLLDEPTATLDPRSQSQVIDLIQTWKGSTKTVIYGDPPVGDRGGHCRPRRRDGRREGSRPRALRLKFCGTRTAVEGEPGARASAYPRWCDAFASAHSFAFGAPPALSGRRRRLERCAEEVDKRIPRGLKSAGNRGKTAFGTTKSRALTRRQSCPDIKPAWP